MPVQERCINCLLSRVRFACNQVPGQVPVDQVEAACLDLIRAHQFDPMPQTQIASAMHRLVRALIANDDPFLAVKQRSTEEALAVCRRVHPTLKTLKDFVLASIIGNTFDYGVQEHQVTSRFQIFFDQAFQAGLGVDDIDLMIPLLDRVVYITDNCGEIVFDRLLIDHLVAQGVRITLAVRDGPVLNDATLNDALFLGLDRRVNVLTTTGGDGELGVNLDVIPPALYAAIHDCTLIISKGMANFESLSLYPNLPPVAYLMSVKCVPVGEMVGMPVGSMVALLKR
ncbi:damage-control phosphatase ARMT1 family protein [Methanosphaerula palustris]|uniref:Damage-control phosphatase ARMT1-like metal-binding domain-containing protein n=1 Tax=Methanosphaerula palustris (strain ATCC BAA-1556 / DSM 19958 / E1-9c) TaxID=521011 RepID=B8GDV1_METPE|nr:ARMT1-like domain-containing protein [Methanosphaerula palustris]ACL17452.1 protein of unknown function DUF89 [Methanosphaerula palustris E1-9c]